MNVWNEKWSDRCVYAATERALKWMCAPEEKKNKDKKQFFSLSLCVLKKKKNCIYIYERMLFCKQIQCIFDFISFFRFNFFLSGTAFRFRYTTIHTFDSFDFKYLSFLFGLSRVCVYGRMCQPMIITYTVGKWSGTLREHDWKRFKNASQANCDSMTGHKYTLDFTIHRYIPLWNNRS